MRNAKRKLELIYLPIVVMTIAAGLQLLAPSLIERFSLFAFDTFQRTAPRLYTDMPVKIVDIDDQSLAAYGQWPWPRTVLAKLVDKLTTAGAAVIAFDIVFAEPDRTSPARIVPSLVADSGLSSTIAQQLEALPDHDSVFAAAIAKSHVVVGQVLDTTADMPEDEFPKRKAGFSFAGNNPLPRFENHTTVITSLPILRDAASGLGSLNQEPDWDGLVRRVPLVFRLKDQLYPSLASEALRLASGAKSYTIKATGASGDVSTSAGMIAIRIGTMTIPTDRTGRFWLHYTKSNPARYISAKSILDGTADPTKLDGSIVLVGTTAAALKDLRSTPLDPVIGGVEVHAQLLEQVLQGWFLNRPDWAAGAEALTIILVGGLLILVLPRLSVLRSGFITLAALGLFCGGAFYAFKTWHMLFDPVYPSLVIITVYGLGTVLGYLRSETRTREIRSAFSRYMSPDLVERLAENPDLLVLGGEMRTMTLMFCDIRGFTTISEGLNAQQLTEFINQFLSPMSEIIMAERGTIDKYIGDCIMAFWNAPLNDSDHARHALNAAQAMRKKLIELNQSWAAEAEIAGRRFQPVRIGIGINSGQCCVGNMGSNQRFDYSVLGDAVNLASRLEGMGKVYGVDLVIGEATVAMLSESDFFELDLVRVKGKDQAVKIYTLLPTERAEEAASMAGWHRSLLDAYRGRNFTGAKEIISTGRSTLIGELKPVYALYLERIQSYLTNAPPADWDGVFTATEK